MDELITLLRIRKIPLVTFKSFVESLLRQEASDVQRITQEIEVEAWQWMKKYDEHVFSFTDCTSFALMKSLNIKKTCTLDKHFKIAGFEVLQ